MSEQTERIAADLDALADELSDVAMAVLRAGLERIEDGSGERAARTERELRRARSSVEKAAHLLRALEP
ncbi:MAG: hypothetical protein ACRDZ5_12180 [Acidimicrobiales bacterium]